jgi:NADH-quinone oxidoreductase subunit A
MCYVALSRPEPSSTIRGVMTAFAPVLVYVIAVAGFVITNLVLTHVIGPNRKSIVKDMPYESGMDPVGDARQPFDVKFYLVAILFLVFDVELLFLYPWAVSAYVDDGTGIPVELRNTMFGVMVVFMATLAIAYVYAWRKGVFKWR